MIAAAVICLGLAGCAKADGDAVTMELAGETQTPGSPDAKAAAAQDGDAGSDSSEKSEDVTEAEEAPPQEIVVYVCGAVNREGVYTFLPGARICDAIEAAGGMRDDSASGVLNQAAFIADGMMIKVPTAEEVKDKTAETTWVTGSAGSGGSAAPAANAGGVGGSTTGQTSGGAAQSLRININTADAGELQKLPGIGASRAQAIIEYRQKNGGFATAEDIMKVTGIKAAMFSKMQDAICVD